MRLFADEIDRIADWTLNLRRTRAHLNHRFKVGSLPEFAGDEANPNPLIPRYDLASAEEKRKVPEVGCIRGLEANRRRRAAARYAMLQRTAQIPTLEEMNSH